ncbi:MAG: B-box zinc finger protein [Christensenellales bacterium]|nr:hypothetical protein [Clostridiales bacterium]
MEEFKNNHLFESICAVHRDRPAHDRCPRCGAFMCKECSEFSNNANLPDEAKGLCLNCIREWNYEALAQDIKTFDAIKNEMDGISSASDSEAYKGNTYTESIESIPKVAFKDNEEKLIVKKIDDLIISAVTFLLASVVMVACFSGLRNVLWFIFALIINPIFSGVAVILSSISFAFCTKYKTKMNLGLGRIKLNIFVFGASVAYLLFFFTIALPLWMIIYY